MSTPILLLNAGSSSIKYQVIDADDEAVLASGLIQRIGDESGTIDHTVDGQTHHQTRGFPNHGRALTVLTQMFDEFGPSLASVKAVGHRTVHGGAEFNSTTLIDDEMLEHLRKLSPLAPLHNPPAIAGIEAARAALPDVPHVAIFDTAFFSSLPIEAYTYAVAKDVAEEHGIRRYGFHGTSHSYVSKKVAEVLGRPYEELNQIVCHLGNGASISAIRGGVAVDDERPLRPDVRGRLDRLGDEVVEIGHPDVELHLAVFQHGKIHQIVQAAQRTALTTRPPSQRAPPRPLHSSIDRQQRTPVE